MKISVIIPVYNSEKYIFETLISIKNQTRQPDEVIISDDGSSDRTKSIVQEFANNGVPPVYYYKNEKKGITNNYLNALSKSKGDIIIVGDHDDVWTTQRVFIIEQLFEKNEKSVLVSADSYLVDHLLMPLGKTIRGGAKKSSLLSRKINQGNYFMMFLRGGLPLLAHTLAFRATINDRLLQRPKHISSWYFEDWVACVASCYGRISFIPDSLVLYRQHNGQTTKSKQPQQHISRLDIYINRLDKMEYLLDLLEAQMSCKNADDELAYKYKLLVQYIEFLKFRINVGQLPFNECFANLLKLFICGRYRQFSSGIFSFGLDAIRLIKTIGK